MESGFFEPPRERKIGSRIGEFEKSGVKLQYSTEEGKRLLVRVIGRFEKLRVREIGIPLYSTEEGKRLLVRVSRRFEKLRVREIGITLYKTTTTDHRICSVASVTRVHN